MGFESFFKIRIGRFLKFIFLINSRRIYFTFYLQKKGNPFAIFVRIAVTIIISVRQTLETFIK